MSVVKVTKAKFASNERATEIRTVCVRIADALQGVNVQGVSNEDVSRALEQARMLVEELKQMGVVAGMHVGLPQERFSDPLLMAEFAAGQAVEIIESVDQRALNMLIHMLYASFDANG